MTKENLVIRRIAVTIAINVFENGNCEYETEYENTRYPLTAVAEDGTIGDVHIGGFSHDSLTEAIGESAKQAVLMWKDATDDFRT